MKRRYECAGMTILSGFMVDSNIDDNVIFNQPKNIDERAEVAQACMLRLELAMPALLDDIQNSTDHAYVVLPERLYVIGTDQRVIYQCGPGPFGFDIPAWEQAIQSIIEWQLFPFIYAGEPIQQTACNNSRLSES
jgi:hypothetical protein